MKRFLLLLATTVKFITPGIEDNRLLDISGLFAEYDEQQQAADPYAFENLQDTALRQLYIQTYTEILITRRSFTSPFLIAAICEHAIKGTAQQKAIIKKAIDDASSSDENTNRFTAKKLNIQSHVLKSGRKTKEVELKFDKQKNIEHQAARSLVRYFPRARQYAQSMFERSGTELDPELIG